jgi:hypothetical protein
VRVIEQFLAAKTGDPEDCEDGIVVTDGIAAVIDGATDKTGRRFVGMTGGRYAMIVCADAIRTLDPAADMATAVSHLSTALSRKLPTALPPGNRPEAVAAIWSQSRREVWQIGDVYYWHHGLAEGGERQRKTVDRYASDMRVAIIKAELAAGADPADLARHDPGRAAISCLLIRQVIFCNNPGAGEWAYPAIDGTTVPLPLVTVHRVPPDVTELILASDGYPVILPTLKASEAMLARLLEKDPLCIDVLRGTKGVTPGNASFDDRAYLSLAV